MKYLLHRMTALLLALLLLCSVGLPALAAQPGLPDPACELGTTPTDMLAAGGRRVSAGDRVYYISEEDGCVYNLDRKGKPVLEGPVAKLNFADGKLYYARLHEDACFDLCVYDLEQKEETVLLANFSGRLGQVYLVDGKYLDFSCDNAVWQLELESGFYRLICFAEGLWSFVPTGAGLVWATGSLFDYSIYADGRLLAEHVDDYTVHFDIGDGLIEYTVEGTSWQADLAQALAGAAQPTAYTGYGVEYQNLAADEELTPEEALLAEEAEMERLQNELADILARPENQSRSAELPAAPPDPAEGVAEDPQLPPELKEAVEARAEAEEGTEEDEAPVQEPAEPVEEPTEPVEEPTEPAPEPTEPVEEPAEPAPEPTEPVAEPTEPALEPTEPVEEPAEPAPEPTEPAPQSGDGEKEPQSADKPGQAEPLSPPQEEPAAPFNPGSADRPAVEVVEPPVTVTGVFQPGEIRQKLSANQINTVKRARQQLNVRWTPVKGVGGWGYYDSSYSLRIYYQAGVTYTGLPYGQVVDTCYIPWGASLSYFVNQVRDSGSKMYTTRSTYSRGSQYYGTDCSSFASWAWNASNRKACYYGTWVGRSYQVMQVGDSVCSNYHAMLVTDVTYNTDGSIHSVEISQANPTTAHTGCCYTTRYTGQTALENMNRSLFVNGSYAVYRRNLSNSVTYAHDCAVPLEGDYCTICGAGCGLDPDDPDPDPDPVEPEPGEAVKPGVDVSYAQGTVNWSTLAPNISFALLRVGFTGNTEGGIYKDSQFDANVAACEARNIPYGVYFYAGATTEDEAREEAAAVLEYLGFMDANGTPLSNPHIPSLPVFYDVEETRNILGLSSNERLLAVISAFCDMLGDFGLRAGVYASKSVWEERLISVNYDRWARWVAQWNTSENAYCGAHVWQYSSTGQLPGFAEGVNVDLNYWLGELGKQDHPSQAEITAPSCTEDGLLRCSCVSCGQIRLNPIPAMGHDFKNGKCTRCGEAQTLFDRFIDIKPGKWYTEAVRFAVDNHLFSGVSETVFGRNTAMSRAMLVTVLYKLAKSPQVEGENLFRDVKESSYYYKPVVWASHNGVVAGTSPTTFSPKREITREQVAVMFLHYYLGYEPEAEQTVNGDLSAYIDEKRISGYARVAMAWAVENGLISGVETDEGRALKPGGHATRAEVAVMILRFAELLEEHGYWMP